MKYSFYDYENAWYNCQVNDCREIGIFLLSKINSKEAKRLKKKLIKVNYQYDLPKRRLRKITLLLSNVRNLLRAHS